MSNENRPNNASPENPDRPSRNNSIAAHAIITKNTNITTPLETFYTFIKYNGEARALSAPLPPYPSLQQLKQIIDPLVEGNLEHITVLTSDNEIRDMFINEMSAGILPRNDLATRFYRNNHLKRYPETPPEDLSAIYGNAVVFSRRVWF